jgi:hypothetical protein
MLGTEVVQVNEALGVVYRPEKIGPPRTERGREWARPARGLLVKWRFFNTNRADTQMDYFRVADHSSTIVGARLKAGIVPE